MNSIKNYFCVTAAMLFSSLAIFGQSPLTSLDGQQVDVQAQSNKVVVLAVGAAWLPLSVKQVDFTNQIAKKYAGKDVVIFYVITDSANPKSKNFATDEDVRKFVTQNKVNVRMLRDPDGAVTLKKFGIQQVPSFVILDRRGSQVGAAIGGIDPKFDITVPISRTIDKIL
jgi:hypothetical protein